MFGIGKYGRGLGLLPVIIMSAILTEISCRNIMSAQEEKSASDQNKKEEKKNPKNKKGDPDQIGNRDVGKGVNFYSLEKEIALGKQIAQELEKTAKLVDDPIISEYVNRVGQNLVRNSDAKVPFTIKVLDTEEPNALSLPGGFFFVNAGLVMLTESESELAGAMAHEIAHVAARHGTRQATRGQLANIASIPLIFWGGWIGYGVRQAAGLAVPLTFVKFTRAFENEADELGAQYLYKTGYDPNALADVFERLSSLEKKKPGTITKIFMDHAPNEERAKNVQKMIRDFPQMEIYVQNTSEFMAVKDRLQALYYSRSARDKKSREESGRPTLRHKPSDKIEVPDKNRPGEEKDEDDRPVLKRRK